MCLDNLEHKQQSDLYLVQQKNYGTQDSRSLHIDFNNLKERIRIMHIYGLVQLFPEVAM